MINNKGLVFKNVFFAIIIFGMIVIGMGVFISDWNRYYNSGVTSDLDEFSRSDEIASTAGVYVEKTTIGDAGSGQDAEVSTFRGAYGILGTLNRAFGVVTDSDGLVSMATDRFGIPSYISYAVVTLMIFAVIFGVIAVVFRLSRGAA